VERLIADPTSAAPIVDELLRLLSVVQVSFPRFASTTSSWRSADLPGAVVLCSLPAANRDPRAGTGDEIDLQPCVTSNLAFGYGFPPLRRRRAGRMELRMAFPLDRRAFPRDAAGGPSGDLEYRALSLVYGVEAVPVTVQVNLVSPLRSRPPGNERGFCCLPLLDPGYRPSYVGATNYLPPRPTAVTRRCGGALEEKRRRSA